MPQLKPLHGLVLAAAIASACGSGGSASSGGVKHVNISFVYSTTTLNAMQEMALGAKAAAQQTPGVSFTEEAPPGTGTDGQAQANLFKSTLKTAKDGVAFQTLTPDAFVQPLQQAASSGIPLVAVDAPPPPSSGVDLFVGNSNFEVGQMLALEMLKRIPSGATGQIVIGNSFPGLPVLDQRVTGMLQVLRQQRPSVQIVGPFDSKRSPDENLAAWRAEVKQYSNALAYMAPSDLDAVSLSQIERQMGKHLLVGGCDLEATALQAIKDGYVYALASPEHWLKGFIAVKLLAERAQQGKPLPQGWWNPGALVINQANVESIIVRQQDSASRTKWFMPEVTKQLANPNQYVKPLSAAI
jgi:ABC-type sugar transport system substrate-binding protein